MPQSGCAIPLQSGTGPKGNSMEAVQRFCHHPQPGGVLSSEGGDLGGGPAWILQGRREDTPKQQLWLRFEPEQPLEVEADTPHPTGGRKKPCQAALRLVQSPGRPSGHHAPTRTVTPPPWAWPLLALARSGHSTRVAGWPLTPCQPALACAALASAGSGTGPVLAPSAFT